MKFLTALLLTLLAAPALADGYVPLRSDLPVLKGRPDAIWPQVSVDDSGFSAASIIALGDWKRTESNCFEGESCESWLRLDIMSIFHGGYVIAQASSRDDLDATGEPGRIAELGGGSTVGGANLFAIQIGIRGGSAYILVSAPDETPIKHLTVLDSDCAHSGAARLRDAGAVAALYTSYCVVDSWAALKRLAVAALNRPPLAKLEFAGSADE